MQTFWTLLLFNSTTLIIRIGFSVSDPRRYRSALASCNPTKHPNSGWNRTWPWSMKALNLFVGQRIERLNRKKREKTWNNLWIYFGDNDKPVFQVFNLFIFVLKFPPKTSGWSIIIHVLGCRFGPESSCSTLVSPIFRSLGTIIFVFCFLTCFFLGPQICNLDDLASYPEDPGWKHQLQPEINLELEKQTGQFYI